jgi:hypothetical protein
MYGPNYIYEPVYYSTPVIYASFGHTIIARMCLTGIGITIRAITLLGILILYLVERNNININLNFNNSYNYVDYRRSARAVVVYNTSRSNGYERQNPTSIFQEEMQKL